MKKATLNYFQTKIRCKQIKSAEGARCVHTSFTAPSLAHSHWKIKIHSLDTRNLSCLTYATEDFLHTDCGHELEEVCVWVGVEEEGVKAGRQS